MNRKGKGPTKEVVKSIAPSPAIASTIPATTTTASTTTTIPNKITTPLVHSNNGASADLDGKAGRQGQQSGGTGPTSPTSPITSNTVGNTTPSPSDSKKEMSNTTFHGSNGAAIAEEKAGGRPSKEEKVPASPAAVASTIPATTTTTPTTTIASKRETTPPSGHGDNGAAIINRKEDGGGPRREEKVTASPAAVASATPATTTTASTTTTDPTATSGNNSAAAMLDRKAAKGGQQSGETGPTSATSPVASSAVKKTSIAPPADESRKEVLNASDSNGGTIMDGNGEGSKKEVPVSSISPSPPPAVAPTVPATTITTPTTTRMNPIERTTPPLNLGKVGAAAILDRKAAKEGQHPGGPGPTSAASLFPINTAERTSTNPPMVGAEKPPINTAMRDSNENAIVEGKGGGEGPKKEEKVLVPLISPSSPPAVAPTVTATTTTTPATAPTIAIEIMTPPLGHGGAAALLDTEAGRKGQQSGGPGPPSGPSPTFIESEISTTPSVVEAKREVLNATLDDSKGAAFMDVNGGGGGPGNEKNAPVPSSSPSPPAVPPTPNISALFTEKITTSPSDSNNNKAAALNGKTKTEGQPSGGTGPTSSTSPIPLNTLGATATTGGRRSSSPSPPYPSSSSSAIRPRTSVTSISSHPRQPPHSTQPSSSKIHRKTGLKKTYYSKTHFSSPFAEREKGPEETPRLVVRLLDGRDLLASDVQTGKSDPICFVWCCSEQELELWVEEIDKHDGVVVVDPSITSTAAGGRPSRVQRTKVCHETCDPNWDMELIFPFQISALEDLLEAYLNIVVRDEDKDEAGNITYDELGWHQIPLSEVFQQGKVQKSSSISLVSKWRPLTKAPGMKRVSGAIRLSLFLNVAEHNSSNNLKQSMGVPTNITAAAAPSPLLELQQRIKDPASNASPTRTVTGSITGHNLANTTLPSPDNNPTRRRDWERVSTVAAPLSLGNGGRTSSTHGGADTVAMWGETGHEEAFPLIDEEEEEDQHVVTYQYFPTKELEGGVSPESAAKTPVFETRRNLHTDDAPVLEKSIPENDSWLIGGDEAAPTDVDNNKKLNGTAATAIAVKGGDLPSISKTVEIKAPRTILSTSAPTATTATTASASTTAEANQQQLMSLAATAPAAKGGSLPSILKYGGVNLPQSTLSTTTPMATTTPIATSTVTTATAEPTQQQLLPLTAPSPTTTESGSVKVPSPPPSLPSSYSNSQQQHILLLHVPAGTSPAVPTTPGALNQQQLLASTAPPPITTETVRDKAPSLPPSLPSSSSLLPVPSRISPAASTTPSEPNQQRLFSSAAPPPTTTGSVRVKAPSPPPSLPSSPSLLPAQFETSSAALTTPAEASQQQPLFSDTPLFTTTESVSVKVPSPPSSLPSSSSTQPPQHISFTPAPLEISSAATEPPSLFDSEPINDTATMTTLTKTSKAYSSRLARMNQTSRHALAAVTKFRGTKNDRTTTASTATMTRRDSKTLALVVSDPAWKNQVLESLARLEQRETQVGAESELRRLSFDIVPHQVLALINAIRKMTNTNTLPTRVALLRVLTRLIRDYSQVAVRSMDSIVAFLLDRVHDPESAIQEPCVQYTSAIAVHLVPLLPLAQESEEGGTERDAATTITTADEVDFMRLIGPLRSAMSEQSQAVQECAGLCVAAIANPAPPILTLQVQTNCRTLEAARDTFTSTLSSSSSSQSQTTNNLPYRLPPTKGFVFLPDGRLLMEFSTSAEARAFHLLKSDSSTNGAGGLPSNWSLLEFPTEKVNQSEDAMSRYISCLGQFCPRLLHSILSTMKLRASVRRPLFQAIRNLALMASTHPKEGRRIGRALALAVAPVAERAIACLKVDRQGGGTGHGGEKGHWKDRTAAAQVVVALAGCYECLPALLEVRPALLATLASGQCDSIRPVREACNEAAATLRELSSSSAALATTPTVAAATTIRMQQDEEGGRAGRPPPYDEVSTEDTSASKSKEGMQEVMLPPNDGGGDMELPSLPMETESLEKSSKAPTATTNYNLNSLLSEPTVAGNNAATVRILKDLAQGITRSTTTLQKNLEKLSMETKESITSLADRLTKLERSVGAAPPSSSVGLPTIEPTTTKRRRSTIKGKAKDMDQEDVGDRPEVNRNNPNNSRSPRHQQQQSETKVSRVSLWREVSWLVHCGELESAYERVLFDGGEKELIRLMNKTGPCLTMLAAHTKILLFTHIAKLLSDDLGRNHKDDKTNNGGTMVVVEQVLPWVIKATQTAEALQFPKPLRKELLRGLYRLSAVPPTVSAAASAPPVTAAAKEVSINQPIGVPALAPPTTAKEKQEGTPSTTVTTTASSVVTVSTTTTGATTDAGNHQTTVGPAPASSIPATAAKGEEKRIPPTAAATPTTIASSIDQYVLPKEPIPSTAKVPAAAPPSVPVA